MTQIIKMCLHLMKCAGTKTCAPLQADISCLPMNRQCHLQGPSALRCRAGIGISQRGAEGEQSTLQAAAP